MPQDEIPITHAISGFNSLTVEIRAKVESLTKQILLVSGGIQTITISAFLGGSKPELTETTISLLKCAWLQLSISIILCLALMLIQIFSLTHVGIKHKIKLENSVPGVEVMAAWLPLRITSWAIGLAAFFLCISGVYTMSKAAISLIGS